MSPHYSTDDLAQRRERQRFLDAAIHNLRAPLRGIGTSAALLHEAWYDRLDDASRAQLNSILEGVTTLDNLARSLADFSMALLPEGSVSAPLPVEHALRAALANLQAPLRETGATVRSGPLPRLAANHEQLTILFRSLLRNAIENRDSEVPPYIEITATHTGDEWTFAVSDNGIGIAPRYQQQVFEPFQRLQNRSRGVGLGLTNCKTIVESHGGRIWVKSQEGRGATFFFTLPSGIGESEDCQAGASIAEPA